MSRLKNRLNFEGNMEGMKGTTGVRLCVFCHHPESFIDVSRERALVAMGAGDFGCMTLYRDDSWALRGDLKRHYWEVYEFCFEEGQAVEKADLVEWLEKAYEWCQHGGVVPLFCGDPVEAAK